MSKTTVPETRDGLVLLGMAGIPERNVRRQVENILKSKAFSTTPQLKEVLRYLVEEALAGRVPTPDDIGKAFGKPDLDGDDSYVRRTVGRVRDQLKEHYEEASPGELRLVIPKGEYFLLAPKIVGTDRAPIPVDSDGKPVSIILEPEDLSDVYARVTVRGRIADLDADLKVWLVVGVSYSYYPQCRVSRKTPEWENDVRIGRLAAPGLDGRVPPAGPDEGGVFDINLVAAGADGDAMFYQYLKAHGDGFGPILPVDVTLLDTKRVIRRDIRPEA